MHLALNIIKNKRQYANFKESQHKNAGQEKLI